MIDFIKAVSNKEQSLLKNKNLSFSTRVDSTTGLLSDWHIAKHKNLTLELHNTGFFMLKGSIHKYYNEGIHNWNQFHFYKLNETLESISDTLEISLKRLKLQNVEVGVNLNTSTSPIKILSGLIEHRNKPFDLEYENTFRKCTHSQYIIKIYDKSLQYGLAQNILRYELKYVKSREFNKFGIYNISDLLKSELWSYPIAEKMGKIWDEITFFDPSIESYKYSEISALNDPFSFNLLNAKHKSRLKKKLTDIHNSNPKGLRNEVASEILNNVLSLH